MLEYNTRTDSKLKNEINVIDEDFHTCVSEEYSSSIEHFCSLLQMVPKSGMVTKPKMRCVHNGWQSWYIIFRQNTQGNGFMEKLVFFQGFLQMLAQDFPQSDIFGILSGNCGNKVTFVTSQFIRSNIF